MTEKLSLTSYDGYPSSEDFASAVKDAIDNASDQDKVTLLTGDGDKPVAAIVPVEVAQFYERALSPAFLIGRDSSLPVRLAEAIVVARSTDRDRSGRMWINGQHFEWATVDGYHLHVSRQSATPGVTLTIAAASVRVDDRP